MFTKRMKICLFSGAILGVICIIGALIRSGFQSEEIFLLALWYNRLIIGLVIGLAGRISRIQHALFRGAFFGLTVSFAFYLSTGFIDVLSFLAGIVYGVMIEFLAYNYSD